MYCNISDRKEHLINIIKWIHEEVVSSGGDGDFLWYSKYYNVRDLFPLVEEFNNSLKFKWTLRWYDEKSFSLDYDQAGWMITNNEEIYNTAPSWQQGLLKY